MAQKIEYCEHCGRGLLKDEQAYVYEGRVVCKQCNDALRSAKSRLCNTRGKNIRRTKQRIHESNVGMWDIKSKYLQEDEMIEYSDRPSMLSCIFAYIWAGFVIFGAMVSLIEGIPYYTNMTSTLLYSLLLALPAIYDILRRLSTRYAISNRCLLKRVGIITTSIKTVPFKHITSVEVKETIVGKIFRYAHLLIDTSGSGEAIEFRWNYVKVAHDVKKLIEKHLVVKN